MVKSFRDLVAYRESYELALDVYRRTLEYPREELYSLTDQTRRAVRSVPANIAEGWGKRVYPAEFKRHLWIALGSLHETSVWIDFAGDHGFLGNAEHDEISRRIELLGGRITSLIKSWRPLARE